MKYMFPVMIIIFYLIMTIDLLVIDTQVNHIMQYILIQNAIKPFYVDFFENILNSSNLEIDYISNITTTVLTQTLSPQCNNALYPTCPNSSDFCCPRLNGTCDECCGDLCRPRYDIICSALCSQPFANNSTEYSQCIGQVNVSSSLSSVSSDLTPGNLLCRNDSECFSNSCGTVGSCGNSVCCTTGKDIFGRCVSQRDLGICNSLEHITCAAGSFCSFNNVSLLDQSFTSENVHYVDPFSLNNNCGVCIPSYTRSGCNFMSSAITDIAQTQNTIFPMFSHLQYLYTNCTENCDESEQACLVGCDLFMTSYPTLNACARYNSYSNKQIASASFISSETSSSIVACCSRCTTLPECAAFAHSPGACRFFSYIVLEDASVSSFETFFILDLPNQPPSPPSPPSPPPPPVCQSFLELKDVQVQCTTDIMSPILTAINASFCCTICNTNMGCNAFIFSPGSLTCTLMMCSSPITLLDIKTSAGDNSFVLREYSNLSPNQSPTSSPLALPLPPSSPKPPFTVPVANQLLRPESLIPIIIGSVVVLCLIVVLFYFCNSERSAATSQVFASIGKTFQTIRGKSSKNNIVMVRSDIPDGAITATSFKTQSEIKPENKIMDSVERPMQNVMANQINKSVEGTIEKGGVEKNF